MRLSAIYLEWQDQLEDFEILDEGEQNLTWDIFQLHGPHPLYGNLVLLHFGNIKGGRPEDIVKRIGGEVGLKIRRGRITKVEGPILGISGLVETALAALDGFFRPAMRPVSSFPLLGCPLQVFNSGATGPLADRFDAHL